MNILLCISGGIAAYKTPELVRELQRAGHHVGAALTPSARHFVAPLVLKTLCDGNVLEDVFTAESEGIGHIDAADWAELVVVAPATANTIAKLATGLADDPVSIGFLAATCPKLVFPAMNVNMWRNPATVRNVQRLRDDGIVVIDPAEGELACGWVGPGRLPELSTIVEHVNRLDEGKTNVQAMAGRRVLITAGPTREFIDPVRYLSNPSTGKMGFALAAAAKSAGASVTVVAGPSNLTTPAGVARVDVVSAEDMAAAVEAQLVAGHCDVFIAAAAVADYTPKHPESKKHKKSKGDQTLELARTTDILATVAAKYDIPCIVGFAAETHDALDYARDKLKRKKLDMIVANEVGQAEGGFADDRNRVWIVDVDGVEEIQLTSKAKVAARIVERIVEVLASAGSGAAVKKPAKVAAIR